MPSVQLVAGQPAASPGGYPPPSPSGFGSPEGDLPGQSAPPKQRSRGLIAAVVTAAVVVVAGAVAFGVPPLREKVFSLFSSDEVANPVTSQRDNQGKAGLKVNNPIDVALADQMPEPVGPPAGFPTCPSGMQTLSWTEYPDGLLLVCGSEAGDFAVRVEGSGDQVSDAVELSFNDYGYEVRLEDGTVISAYLGGALVTTAPTIGDSHTVTASQSWDLRSGAVGPAPTVAYLPPCPGETWPISLSVWNGGWLRVCGAGPGQASRLDFYDDLLGEGTASGVEASGDGYCGTTADGTQACVNRVPALVKFAAGAVLIQQRAVGMNAFAGQVSGGAGQGTGAFGVPAPADTDRDQVRYLVEILDKSAGARAKLGPAVTATAACENVAGQVDTIRSIADNRQELLDALQLTPVDKVPGGSGLVAQLTEALEASLGADLAYLAWAEAKRDSGCAAGAGQSYYDTAGGFDTRASDAKRRFVDNWNSTIAAQYGVPALEESQI